MRGIFAPFRHDFQCFRMAYTLRVFPVSKYQVTILLLSLFSPVYSLVNLYRFSLPGAPEAPPEILIRSRTDPMDIVEFASAVAPPSPAPDSAVPASETAVVVSATLADSRTAPTRESPPQDSCAPEYGVLLARGKARSRPPEVEGILAARDDFSLSPGARDRDGPQ